MKPLADLAIAHKLAGCVPAWSECPSLAAEEDTPKNSGNQIHEGTLDRQRSRW